jgi:hypothetical protein
MGISPQFTAKAHSPHSGTNKTWRRDLVPVLEIMTEERQPRESRKGCVQVFDGRRWPYVCSALQTRRALNTRTVAAGSEIIGDALARQHRALGDISGDQSIHPHAVEGHHQDFGEHESRDGNNVSHSTLFSRCGARCVSRKRRLRGWRLRRCRGCGPGSDRVAQARLVLRLRRQRSQRQLPSWD